jgi:hypothetical protein
MFIQIFNTSFPSTRLTESTFGKKRGYSIMTSPRSRTITSPIRVKSPKPRILKEIEHLSKNIQIKSNYINRPMIDVNRPHLEFNMRYYLTISSQKVAGLTRPSRNKSRLY